MVGDQLLLLGVGHGLQRVVLALELPVQAGQGWRNHFSWDLDQVSKATLHPQLTLHGHLLDGSALAAAGVGGQGEGFDAASGANAAGQDVVGVKVVAALAERAQGAWR